MSVFRNLANISFSFALFLAVPPVAAQNLTEMMLEGMAREGATRAEEMLQKAPEQLQDYLTERQQEFETERECVSELQLLANAGALASNIMPFSSVWAYEDEGDLRTRLRLVVNGEKFHADFRCEGQRLFGDVLAWNEPTPEFPEHESDTLNAGFGAFLILNERGAFTEPKDIKGSISPSLQACGVNTEVGGIGGPFTLLDAYGQTVTDKDVITGPTLIYFGYSLSPDVTPIDLTRNVQAVDLLHQKGQDVTAVFISVDPDRDKPSVIGDFVSQIDDGLMGLTGTQVQVEEAVQAYRAYYRRQSGDVESYLVDHSTFTYLVFPEAGFVEFFRRELPAEEVAARVGCLIDASNSIEGVLESDSREQNGSIDDANAIADALRNALKDAQKGSHSQTPLTQGEVDGFRINVQDCWVVDVGSPAANITVTVGFDMDPTGRVVSSSVRLLSSEGGSGSDVDVAFQAARRAILRCQGDGYSLPISKYDNWKSSEMTFNVDSMRVR